MKNNGKLYLILGTVFLCVGITKLMTKAVSSVIAYGDFVIAVAFYVLAAKAK